jgi:hypothetical protein
MRRLLTLPFVLGLSLLAGCASPEPVPDGIEVVILRGHIHSRYCGHYVHGHSWYYLRDHKHAVNCGHEYVGGAWQLED